jgi:hypothetical protein
MSDFKKYNKFLKVLNKEEKREFRETIRFLQTAMVCEMIRDTDREYVEFLDAQGHAEFYTIAMEVCDEILLKDNSEFLKYYKLFLKSGDCDYFHVRFDTCMDWYHMDLAREELAKRMEGYKKQY